MHTGHAITCTPALALSNIQWFSLHITPKAILSEYLEIEGETKLKIRERTSMKYASLTYMLPYTPLFCIGPSSKRP